MKKASKGAVVSMIPVLVLAGCAATSSQTRTTAPPAGPVQAATTEPGVIPAGTTFAVRTNEDINSEQSGKVYAAEVVQDIVDQSGKVLVPNKSPVQLVIAQATSAGTVGTATMELALRSVTVNGRRYAVTTAGVEQRGDEGLGRSRRTAEMVGGGALLGTLIGAVAGGGSGAAIGAVAGAAGGAAAQVITRGKEVRVPAETVLTFRLDQPLRLEGFAG
jgi:hypothetical protein